MDITTRRIGMQLGRRPKRKQDQALDVVASAAKTWSEWQLGKRAGKGVRKATKKAAQLKTSKPSGLKGAATGTPAKITGLVALVGGLGAIVARKLKGGSDAAEPYAPPPINDTAPGPPEGVNPTAAAITHNAPPPAPLAAAPPPPSAKPDVPAAVKAKAASSADDEGDAAAADKGDDD
jgi:hypothetical protein